MPCASSCRVGFPFVFRYPTVAITNPGMQNAHWTPCSSTTPCCTGCSVPSADASPSIVTIFFPRTECVSVEHEYRGTSSITTVHAPLLAVDRQGDEPLHAARRRGLPAQRRRAKEVARRGHGGPCRDDPLDEVAPRGAGR